MFETIVYTLFLGLFFGPGAASSYALAFHSPENVFLILAFLYVTPLLAFFKMAHLINYKHVRRRKFIKHVSSFAKMEVEKAIDMVDDLVVEFGKRGGELGYMLGLVIISFLFGVYLAFVLAYFLKVDEAKAFFSISVGTMLGIIFWITVISYSIKWISTDMFLGLGLLIAGFSMVYGRKREIRTIEETVKKHLKAGIR